MENLKTFVHLKDDVVFAYHQSATEIDIPGDNIIQVEVEGESLLGKKYNNGNFINAPIIKYAIIDIDNNTVIGINKTFFSSEVNGPIINNENVKVLWTWDGDNFNSPEEVIKHNIIQVGSTTVTTSDILPAVTAEKLLELAAAEQAMKELIIPDPNISS
jgi:hypothetical protein